MGNRSYHLPQGSELFGMNKPVLGLKELGVYFMKIAIEARIFDGHGCLIGKQGQEADIGRGNGSAREEVVHDNESDGFFFGDQRDGGKGPAAEPAENPGIYFRIGGGIENIKRTHLPQGSDQDRRFRVEADPGFLHLGIVRIKIHFLRSDPVAEEDRGFLHLSPPPFSFFPSSGTHAHHPFENVFFFINQEESGAVEALAISQGDGNEDNPQ